MTQMKYLVTNIFLLIILIILQSKKYYPRHFEIFFRAKAGKTRNNGIFHAPVDLSIPGT